VVRLPRDWLGPREELVPVGPAALRGLAAPFDDGLPPTAEAFWSEDSAALHDAVRAPAAEPPSPWPTPARSPSRPPWRWRARRPSILWLQAVHLRPRARWALLSLPIGALLVLALIASTERPTSPPAGRLSASASASAQRQQVARDAAAGVVAKTSSAAATHPAAKTRVTARRPLKRRNPAHHARARHIASASRARRHTNSQPRRASSSSAAPTPVSVPTATTVAAPAASYAASNTGSPSVATPSTSPNSSTRRSSDHIATSASHTTFGENGTLGPGSSPDS
jgi:hypothetical protein